jgi:hypothetical protein
MSRSSAGLAPTYSERFARSLSNADLEIARRSSGVGGPRDAASSSEYQEIMLLKVRTELEAARVLSSAARLGAELAMAAENLRLSDGAGR